MYHTYMGYMWDIKIMKGDTFMLNNKETYKEWYDMCILCKAQRKSNKN